jgi:mono/diheme cytochrome c family protein
MKKMLLIATMLGLTAALSAKAADAKNIWAHHCAMCHGEDGKGDTKIGHKLGVKDFTDAKVQAALTDAAATKAIKEGVKSDAGKTLMKPFDNLSDADVNALVTYLRGLKK